LKALDRALIRPVVFSTRPEALDDDIGRASQAVCDWRHVDGWSDEALAHRSAFTASLFPRSIRTHAGHRLKVFAATCTAAA